MAKRLSEEESPKKPLKAKATTTETPTSESAEPVKKKKPKVRVVEDGPPAIARISSAFLTESLGVMRKEYGDANICAAGEAGKIVIGLPLPGLAFEYLIQNTVWPLGRFTQIVGKHGSCKSALSFEIVRWFKESYGLGYLLENETKYSPDYALSILGYPQSAEEEVLAHIPCHSVDDWQSKLQRTMNWCKDKMKQKEIGRKFPVLFVLDSLMGKLAEESQNKIQKSGSADRSHPLEAMMINSFLKKIPQDLEEWPMCFICTNHLKPQKTETGAIERKIAGGAAPGFQETFEIEMGKDQNPDIRLVDEEGFEIGGLKVVLACKKNSLGETNRKIKAEIKWVHREDPETGEFKQFTKWDWPAATTHLLASFDAGHRAEKIKEIVHIGGSGNKWYSKTLGIPSAEPVSAHDLGVLIEADPQIKQALRRLFGIKERKVFQPGVDYLKQLADCRAEVDRKVAKL